jgi:hypothetical protein
MAPYIPIGGAANIYGYYVFNSKISYVLSLGVFDAHSRMDSIAGCEERSCPVTRVARVQISEEVQNVRYR